MSSRDRVTNRAHQIYDFLSAHLGEKFTLPELCDHLDFEPGSTTRNAIRKARDLATEAGYHFPPAVPANDHTYTVTNMAADVLDPTAHMSRIESGARARKEQGIEFLRRERQSLPNDLKPVADMYVSVHDAARNALATIQKAADDMTVELIKARREGRAAE